MISERSILERQKHEDLSCIDDVLRYYKKNGRHDLVWRKKINPYKILVSEIMLQQTQVARVITKFKLWMKQYPTLTKLSMSTLQDVLILWQGLGYQRRAKSLLTIAKTVKRLPKEYDDLCRLSGIGVYTASAICAFAYNRFSHPVLETNIRTVLIEFFHKNEERINDKTLYEDLYRLETYRQVHNVGARVWYYALMDYGAYLKAIGISHNGKSFHASVQTKYKGSLRELRAKTLFAITSNSELPADARLPIVIEQLQKEGYITTKQGKFAIARIM